MQIELKKHSPTADITTKAKQNQMKEKKKTTISSSYQLRGEERVNI